MRFPWWHPVSVAAANTFKQRLLKFWVSIQLVTERFKRLKVTNKGFLNRQNITFPRSKDQRCDHGAEIRRRNRWVNLDLKSFHVNLQQLWKSRCSECLTFYLWDSFPIGWFVARNGSLWDRCNRSVKASTLSKALDANVPKLTQR